MNGSIIKSCNCKHEYQDRRYGAGKRLHNYMKKETGKQQARCTVCGTIKNVQ